MAKTLFIDTSKCMGCRGCESACKQWNDLQANIKGDLAGEKFEFLPFNGTYQTKTDFAHQTYTFVTMNEFATDDGGVKWLFGKKQCMHCAEATCMMVCPVGALERTADGTVNLDREKCTGCGYCVQNCPFGVPQLDEGTASGFAPAGSWSKKASKCNMCADRVANGLIPACAKTCPPGAIKFGEREEMLAAAQARLDVIKEAFPLARIYGEKEVGGTVLYLLTEHHTRYGFPDAVSVPWQVRMWKWLARPVGELALGGSLAFVLLAAIGCYAFPQKKHTEHHVEGGK